MKVLGSSKKGLERKFILSSDSENWFGLRILPHFIISVGLVMEKGVFIGIPVSQLWHR